MHFALISPAFSWMRIIARLLLALCLVTASLSAALPVDARAKPAANAWPETIGMMTTRRSGFTATLLPTGRVLAAGGYDDSGTVSSAELYNPGDGTWRATQEMNGLRWGHTATLLLNGKVLVVGGRDETALATAELFDPTAGSWTPAASLPAEGARSQHTATLLKDGKVLVVGGQGLSGPLNTAQVYDPKLNNWTATPPLAARFNHTANLLPDGRVMVVGGSSSAAMASIQVYNPADNTWSGETPGLTTARYNHTTTALPDGRLLVVGGMDGSAVFKSAELITYSAGSWSKAPAGTLNFERQGHSATLLADGKVLVAAGQSLISATEGFLGSGELYDVGTNTWTPVIDPMSYPRTRHSATLLPGGQVLIAGGQDMDGPFSLSELYNPVPGGWSGAGVLRQKSYSATATTLKDGRTLVVGGTGTAAPYFIKNADLFNPLNGIWAPAADLNQARVLHTATLLTNGKVLVTGGQTIDNKFLRTAELYDPQQNTWTPTGSMIRIRASHTATLLPNGQVMVTGGIDEWGVAMDSVEIYDPGSGSWILTNSMNLQRSNHTATLLQNGDVLVVGGLNVAYLSSTEIYQAASGTWWEIDSLGAPRAFHTATLVSGGKVLIAGGYTTVGGEIVAYLGCQLYEPGSGWRITGSLNDARGEQTATLLGDGRVLVAGGAYYVPVANGPRTLRPQASELRPVSSSELFDPATEQWILAGDLVTPRFSHAAALLSDSRVMVISGMDQINVFDTAEIFDSGIGFADAWRPLLDPIPAEVTLSKPLALTGSQLRGYNWVETSGGNASGSATNYPLIQLRRVDNGQVRWLTPDAKAGFSDSAFTSAPVTQIKAGLAVLTVYVNGIPSRSQMIEIKNNYLYVALTSKAGLPRTRFMLPLVYR